MNNQMRRTCAAIALGAGLWLVMPAAAQAPRQPAQPRQQFSPEQLVAIAEEKYRIGTEEQQPEQLVEALDLLREALELDPLNTAAKLLAADILMDSNDYNSARDYYRAVLDVEPSNLRANLGYGKILNANRSYRQAAAYLIRAENVATESDEIVEVKRALAVAYAELGRTHDAIEKMNEATRAAPDNLDALESSVQIRFAAVARDPSFLPGAMTAAETYVDKAKANVQEMPWDKRRVVRLARAYELQLAVLKELHNSYYERDIRNQPTDRLLLGKGPEAAAALMRTAEIVRELALLRLTLSDHDALLLMEKAVEYDPENVAYLEGLAVCYRRVGNQEQAVGTCQRILELQPEHSGAREYLDSVGVAPTPAGSEQ